jgi:hypothetical protein
MSWKFTNALPGQIGEHALPHLKARPDRQFQPCDNAKCAHSHHAGEEFVVVRCKGHQLAGGAHQVNADDGGSQARDC